MHKLHTKIMPHMELYESLACDAESDTIPFCSDGADIRYSPTA